jgi:RNA polymerase sigma factor (sigma-70 family)
LSLFQDGADTQAEPDLDMNDAQLLREFVEGESERAFRQLVDQHLPLVIGTARRATGNDALAEEIAQAVFILLAQKASRLSSKTILSGWLYRTTRFVAARSLQSEARRRRREQEAAIMQTDTETDPAWTSLVPHLDDALGRLSEPDRTALLLRFFEEQSNREIGVAMGVSEDAAKKRVARALELCSSSSKV